MVVWSSLEEGQFRLALSSSGENSLTIVFTQTSDYVMILRIMAYTIMSIYTQVFISNTVAKMLKTLILV